MALSLYKLCLIGYLCLSVAIRVFVFAIDYLLPNKVYYIAAALEAPLFCVKIKLICKKVNCCVVRISVVKHKTANLCTINAKLKQDFSNSSCYLLAAVDACKL